MNVENLKSDLSKAINELKDEKERAKEDFDKMVKEKDKDINSLNERIATLLRDEQDSKNFKQEKEKMEKDIRDLNLKLKACEEENKLKQNELERENITNTENLRKEMLTKIKETKANLLALNDEQLQTTTTLTIL